MNLSTTKGKVKEDTVEMAKAHGGNAFSTDFTSMFNNIAPTKSAEKKKNDAENIINNSSKTKEPSIKLKNQDNAELTKDISKPQNKADETIIKSESTTKIKEKAAPKDEGKIINPKSKKAAENGEVYQTISLTSTDARDYLKYRSKELGLKTSDFFWQIVEEDIEKIQNKKINPMDEEHQQIKTATLGC